jgi:hypothetical protein
VYVNTSASTSGSFRIVTGTIYGSSEDEGIKNTAANGAALYFENTYGSPTECGTFSGETWNSNGPLDRTDDTIKVVKGVLQQ